MSTWDYNNGDDRRRERSNSHRMDMDVEQPYPSHEDSQGYDERERYRQWEQYERDRAEWERRRDELRVKSPNNEYGYDRPPLKRPRSPSPYGNERYMRPRYDSYDGYIRDRRDDYDRDRRRDYSPEPRYRRDSSFPDPMSQDKLVTFRVFSDWYRDMYPERYREEESAKMEGDDPTKSGVRARYEEYKTQFSAKQVRFLFDKHRKAAWFLEKYDPRDKYSDLRNRIRKAGWQGTIDQFISELKAGNHDPVDPLPLKEVKPEGELNGSAPKLDEEYDKALSQTEEDPRFADYRKRVMADDGGLDGDEIVIPQKGYQVMIKTIPPDIGRLQLEPVVSHLPGFQSLALGEPVARRQYYRSAWIEFDTVANARNAIDKLTGEEIESFRLHLTLITSPLVSKLKRTSIVASTEERMTEDLETIKALIVTLEKESAALDNYVPLSERQTEDVSKNAVGTNGNGNGNGSLQPNGSTSPPNEVPTAPPAPSNKADGDVVSVVDRGTIAVESRLAILLPPGDEGIDKYKRLSMTMDVYMAYLRVAFHCCYYCAVVADRADELQRKCVKHLRGRWSPEEMAELNRSPKRRERDNHWLMCHDDKMACLVNRDAIDPVKYGGKSYDDEMPTIAKEYYAQEDDSKYRCITCSKMFRSAGYVCKHISNKHPDLLNDSDLMYEFRLYNNFALDPHRIQLPPPNTSLPLRGPPGRDGRRPSPPNDPRRANTLDSVPVGRRRVTPPPNARLDPRAASAAARMTYQDLDEVAAGEDVALMY